MFLIPLFIIQLPPPTLIELPTNNYAQSNWKQENNASNMTCNRFRHSYSLLENLYELNDWSSGFVPRTIYTKGLAMISE